MVNKNQENKITNRNLSTITSTINTNYQENTPITANNSRKMLSFDCNNNNLNNSTNIYHDSVITSSVPLFQSSLLSTTPIIPSTFDLNWNNLINIYKNSIIADSNNSSYAIAGSNTENLVISLINEFISLEEYLKNEYKLYDELEKMHYFSNEEKIIDFINNDKVS